MQVRALAIAFTICSCVAFAASSCPVTNSPTPAFVPPPRYPRSQGTGFYLGTSKLWVYVYPSPWSNLPRWPEGYRQKIAWFSEGYNAHADPEPAIVISGRRLDGDAPPLIVTGANGSWTSVDFIMSGVNFPKAGCWEITGRFKGAEVKFVVLVE